MQEDRIMMEKVEVVLNAGGDVGALLQPLPAGKRGMIVQAFENQKIWGYICGVRALQRHPKESFITWE